MNTSAGADRQHTTAQGAAAQGAGAPDTAAPEEVSRDQRQAELVAALTQVLPRGAILFRHEDTAPYECDALTAYRASPMVVVLPESDVQVAATLKVCHRMGVPVIARGAGTG